MSAKNCKMFIDGKWVDALSGKTFEDMNPYTGEVYAYLPSSSREDARRAIEAAQKAFPAFHRLRQPVTRLQRVGDQVAV